MDSSQIDQDPPHALAYLKAQGSCQRVLEPFRVPSEGGTDPQRRGPVEPDQVVEDRSGDDLDGRRDQRSGFERGLVRTAAAAGEPRRPQVTGPQHGKHRSTPVRLSRGKGDRTAVDEMPRSNVIAFPDQDLVLRQPNEDGRSERSKASRAKPAAIFTNRQRIESRRR